MDEAFECGLVGLKQILYFACVLVLRKLVIAPVIHQVIGFLGILVDEFAIHKIFLGDVVVGGLVLAQL